MDLRLYHYFRSSSSWRVRWALAHKKVPYEAVAVNLLEGAQTQAEYRAANPTGYVPCLVVDGRALGESVAIVELIDDLFPEPRLRPADPWQRARMRQLVEIVNAGTQPLQNLWVLRKMSSEKDGQAAWAREVIGRGLAAFETLLAAIRVEGTAGPFCFGEAPTLADLFLVPQLFNARRFATDLGPYPLCLAVEQAALATEACRVAAPDAWEAKT
jgi:maleylacetoacetate isomerase